MKTNLRQWKKTWQKTANSRFTHPFGFPKEKDKHWQADRTARHWKWYKALRNFIRWLSFRFLSYLIWCSNLTARAAALPLDKFSLFATIRATTKQVFFFLATKQVATKQVYFTDHETSFFSRRGTSFLNMTQNQLPRNDFFKPVAKRVTTKLVFEHATKRVATKRV